MANISKRQLEDMRRFVNGLTELLDVLEEKPIVVAPDIAALVEERLKARICLACGQKALDDEQIRRGQDSACYSTTRGRIRRGLVTERQLIEQGKLTAEHATSGRPAKQDLTSEEKRAIVEQDVAAFRAKQAAKKAKRDGKE